ncbi:MAG: Gx transporter family protein [Treponema sp.]|nr:Gx transporter family protein [Treponema sp.]
MLTASHGNKDLTPNERAVKSFKTSSLEASSLALLGAFCLFLCAVEYMIPKPLPFMRIGLANLPIILACCIFPLHSFLILVCIKVIGQALITGTLFSYIFLFSITGTFLSALLMYFLCNALGRKYISFIGVGAAGAVVSNFSQLVLAYFFIFRENTIYIAPAFLLAGLITGIVLGIFCEVFAGKSKWFKGIKNEKA